MPHCPDAPKKSRRWFLTGGLSKSKEPPQMVKMLTPDGKLVEIEKSVLDRATQRIPATHQAVFQWMQNPSKSDQPSLSS